MNFDTRSANVSHPQSVAGEERGDKLGGIAGVTVEPPENR
jgi:hypothetical protein